MTDMQALRWTSSARGLVLLGAMLAAMAIPAAAADGEFEDNMPDAVLMREILKGLGLKRGDEAIIDYRERSPLVVPPSNTLPPPDTRTLTERNPNWPVDQDIRRNRARAAARAELSNQDPYVAARPLPRDELDKGRRSGGRNGGSADPYIGQTLSPSALGYVGGIFDSMFEFGGPKVESKPFTSEPPREALVEPPPGYQTPAPGAPYGIGKQKFVPRNYNPLTMQYE
jgi:hypothetical protein